MNRAQSRDVRVPLLAALWIVLGPAWATGEPALQPLTVDEVTADTVSWGARLSPSGRYLALLRGTEKMAYIVVADLHDEAAKPFTHPIPHGVVKWVAWDSDDRILFATHFWADKLGNPIPLDEVSFRSSTHVVRLLAMDRDGKNVVLLFADNQQALRTINLANVTDFLPDDPKHIIAPAWDNGRLSLFRVNTYGNT